MKIKTFNGPMDLLDGLLLLFIALKLTGHISWPWILVLSPALIPLSIVATALLISAIIKNVE